MDIAALILATLSLVMSTGLLAVFLGKNYFSSHVVQLQPVDSLLGGAPPVGPKGTPIGDEFREFDELTPEEEEYFRKQRSNLT